MTLPSPHLDDRRFQGLVDEAKRLVQQRCPEWTDHNVSDPGVTLIEAFATMVDQLVYRVNRVPEKSYLTFLDLIGVRLHPPTAAHTDVTFRLSAPRPDPVVVRAGTEVATVRTETEEAVVFTTAEQLTITPCAFAHLATWPVSGEAADRTDELAIGRDVTCFGATPAPGDCLYVGLSAAVPAGVVGLRLDCKVEGVGVDPLRPPLVWEAWDGTAWTVCEIEKDDTGGFNRSGELILHLPRTHTPAAVVRRTGGWLRCRLIDAQDGRPTYLAPPVLRRITAFTIGATVAAEHAETVADEVLGAAEGVPGQVFELARPPVVPGDFVVEVADPGSGPEPEYTRWTRVDDFAHSGPEDHHITLDPNSGRVEFGPAVRERDGSVRHYGAVPPKGATVRVRSYRTGGGLRGNVARSTLKVLRSAIPYVARVENRRPALGGVDGESVDSARVRGPMTLRTLHRAVVPHDYELLARDIAPDAARVHCIRAGEPGDDDGSAHGVRLLVVPAGRSDEQGRIEFDELIPRRTPFASSPGTWRPAARSGPASSSNRRSTRASPSSPRCRPNAERSRSAYGRPRWPRCTGTSTPCRVGRTDRAGRSGGRSSRARRSPCSSEYQGWTSWRTYGSTGPIRSPVNAPTPRPRSRWTGTRWSSATSTSSG